MRTPHIKQVAMSISNERFVDRREVDFVVVEGKTPKLFVECKLSDGPASTGLHYLVQRFPKVPAWQIAADGQRDFQTPEGIRCAPAPIFLATLV